MATIAIPQLEGGKDIDAADVYLPGAEFREA